MTKINKKKIKKKLTIKRVAVLCSELGVSRTTVNSAIGRGEIPVVQLGDGLDCIEPKDLKAWIKRGPDKPVGRPFSETKES
jgi:excisionase family DNA binding protein